MSYFLAYFLLDVTEHNFNDAEGLEAGCSRTLNDSQPARPLPSVQEEEEEECRQPK